MELNEATRELRSSVGLSQEKFAALIGMGIATVQRWEQGTSEPNSNARASLYRLSREQNRDDLAAVFIAGKAPEYGTVSSTAESLVFDVIPTLMDFVASASIKLMKSLGDPLLDSKARGAAVGEAISILLEHQEYAKRVLSSTLPGIAAECEAK